MNGYSLHELPGIRERMLARLALIEFAADDVDEARKRLECRLARWDGAGRWDGRFTRKSPAKRGLESTAHVLIHDQPELAIVRALALTDGRQQFTCNASGAVFSTSSNGWSKTMGARIDVTGLSLVLDEVADVLVQRTSGAGGRFYEESAKFFTAKRPIVAIAAFPDPA